jgi:hypothetical protein
MKGAFALRASSHLPRASTGPPPCSVTRPTGPIVERTRPVDKKNHYASEAALPAT